MCTRSAPSGCRPGPAWSETRKRGGGRRPPRRGRTRPGAAFGSRRVPVGADVIAAKRVADDQDDVRSFSHSSSLPRRKCDMRNASIIVRGTVRGESASAGVKRPFEPIRWRDLVAGFSVALVLVPQSLAYAELGGHARRARALRRGAPSARGCPLRLLALSPDRARRDHEPSHLRVRAPHAQLPKSHMVAGLAKVSADY